MIRLLIVRLGSGWQGPESFHTRLTRPLRRALFPALLGVLHLYIGLRVLPDLPGAAPVQVVGATRAGCLNRQASAGVTRGPAALTAVRSLAVRSLADAASCCPTEVQPGR
jgi:hypothetical protein